MLTIGNLCIGILGSLLGLTIYWTLRDWYAAIQARTKFREFVCWYIRRIQASSGSLDFDEIASQLLNVRRPPTLTSAGFYSQFGPLLVENYKYVTDAEYAWLIKFNKALKRHAWNIDRYNDQWVNSMARSNRLQCLRIMYFLLVKIHLLEIKLSMISEKLLEDFRVSSPKHMSAYNSTLSRDLDEIEQEIHRVVEETRAEYIWRYRDSRLNTGGKNGAAA